MPVSPALETLPMRMANPGVAIVPSELMAQVQRQWSKFVWLAALCLLLAVSTIAGWYLYIHGGRELKNARGALVTAQNRVADLDKQLKDESNKLLKVEARLAGTDGATESQLAAAERARSTAEEKREAADRARGELEAKLKSAEQGRLDADSKLAAAERTRVELETKLKTAEQGRLDAEGKLATAERARVDADSKVVEAERSLAVFREQAARLQADIQTYRQEAQAAREGERTAIQRLQDAAKAGAAADSGAPALVAPTAGSDAVRAPAGADPGRSASTPETTWEAPAEANTATQPAVPTETAPAEPEMEVLDPETEQLKPTQLLPMGEALIIAGHPQRAVAMIRKAIEKGGRGAVYQKSLGWALMQAGRHAEAKVALEAAMVGFEDWAASSSHASPDHWTAAFLLGRVREEDYTRHYVHVTDSGHRLDCLPWFYVGQRREIEGHRQDALDAYRVCVALGQTPNAYPIWRWAQDRMREMEKPPVASQPAP